MTTLQPSGKIAFFLLLSLFCGIPLQAHPASVSGEEGSSYSHLSSSSCEDFAQRQIKLAEGLLQKSNYTRAIKVLNSTAQNCDIEEVREKIVEAFEEWYNVVQGQGQSAFQRFMNVLSSQSYVSSAQKARFERRATSYVLSLLKEEYGGGNFRSTYRLCRSYSDFVNENFVAEYYCGTSAKELGAKRAMVNSYEWLIQNWNGDQSLATWTDIAGTLEEHYFLNGRFEDAYALARKRARRDPSPESVLSSVISIRGQFTAPLLRAGSIFYRNQPSQSALSHVRSSLKRINFPKYVKAFYTLKPNGKVERGMYGNEANQPDGSLLEKVEGTISLLQSTGDSMAWLVSPLEERFLVLELGVATTPEESVRLETIYENIESDEQWKKLYSLTFTETAPAIGSAVGTFISSSSIADQDLSSYRKIFDASSLLSYYCIQNDVGGVQESYNFDRESIGYEDTKWKETSKTRSLYHHSITYSGQSVREVVWPIYIQKNWNGVIRIGLTQN